MWIILGYNWEKQSTQIPAIEGDRNKMLKNKLAFKVKPKIFEIFQMLPLKLFSSIIMKYPSNLDSSVYLSKMKWKTYDLV